jgi:hypothetical protein
MFFFSFPALKKTQDPRGLKIGLLQKKEDILLLLIRQARPLGMLKGTLPSFLKLTPQRHNSGHFQKTRGLDHFHAWSCGLLCQNRKIRLLRLREAQF